MTKERERRGEVMLTGMTINCRLDKISELERRGDDGTLWLFGVCWTKQNEKIVGIL